jgi:SAM-dependent methyltransferase
MDRDPGLLELARQEHASIANLRFESGDATTLDQTAQYDFVTAARTLQWIPEPGVAIQNMKRALKPGGLLIVLDYNHRNNTWEPEPPEEFKVFYRAFLAWRSGNGCDNQIADHLPPLFESAGLINVASHGQDEVVERGAIDFGERAALWLEVIDNVGAQLVGAGFCTNDERERARTSYAPWVNRTLQKQTLAMAAVIGVAP